MNVVFWGFFFAMTYIALVCLHVEALFGRAPFASKSYTELVEKIRSNQPIEVINTILINYWIN